MTRTSDTVRTHLQRYRTLGEGLLKLCAHQSPYTGRTHRLFPPPQVASVRPRFEPTATPPSRVTSRGCYRYANPPWYTYTHIHVYTYVYMHGTFGLRFVSRSMKLNDYSLSSFHHEFRRERKPDFAEEESVGLLKALRRGRRD